VVATAGVSAARFLLCCRKTGECLVSKAGLVVSGCRQFHPAECM